MDAATLRKYVEGYDRRRAERLPERRAAAERALALVPALAEACRRAGAARVRLFGSLVTGLWGETPDVDLAIDGLPPARYFPLLAELTGMAAPVDVDLIDLATCPPALRARIENEGIDA